ncbi:hypothetical protein F2Q68_00003687 [Brassica cretica]|uniref:Uncharacterized protein n=1 Tax=Brassica cretica TaxID=69181 RepID=A0A8S9JH14_BRACR|nr:hypothetical protein F2Q68_00003687 [Brassica cretica]
MGILRTGKDPYVAHYYWTATQSLSLSFVGFSPEIILVSLPPRKDDLSIDLLLTRISVDFELDRRSIWRFPHRAVDFVSISWCEAVMKNRREKELLRMNQFEVKGLFEGRIEVIQEAR